MNHSTRGLSIAATLVVLMVPSRLAHAQQPGTNVATPLPAAAPDDSMAPPPALQPSPLAPEPVIDASTTRRTIPNRPLLVTGTVLLGASYGAAAIVGAISDRPADDKLYYPVVGPWMDIRRRGCSEDPCDNNTLNRVLIGGDGVLQGLGALGILLSLVVPEKTTRSWYLLGSSKVVVFPTVASGAPGFGAVGRF